MTEKDLKPGMKFVSDDGIITQLVSKRNDISWYSIKSYDGGKTWTEPAGHFYVRIVMLLHHVNNTGQLKVIL